MSKKDEPVALGAKEDAEDSDKDATVSFPRWLKRDASGRSDQIGVQPRDHLAKAVQAWSN
jgi:hypothetical protein